jgi:DNA end-binding protein Ku
MGARAIWKGRIRFGGVEVPVKMYSAVQDRSVHFHLLDAKHHERVRQHMIDADSGKVVDPDAIRRAFEGDEGQLAVIEAPELEKVAPKPSRDIEITHFLPPGAIANPWYDRPYWLGPDEEDGGYFALAQAMAKRGVEGLARWVMRNKEYVGALRVEREYLMLITLRHAGEVIPASALPAPSGRDLSERELGMAKQLIGSMEDRFDIAAYHDEYRERVIELIEAKAAGKVVRFPKAPARKTGPSLEDLLERSVAAAGRERKRA